MKHIKDTIINIINKINNIWDKFINIKGINFIFKFLPHNLLLFIFFVASILSVFSIYKKNHYEYDFFQNYGYQTTDPILIYPYEIDLDDITLTGTPDKVCFKIATFNRHIKSVYDLSLIKDGNMEFNIPIQTKNLSNNDIYCEKIPEILNNGNIKDYKLVIRPIKADDKNAIAFFKNEDTNKPLVYFAHSKNIFCLNNIIIFIFFISLLILNHFINKKKINIERFYLIISILYIIPITFIIPPYQVPDETIHFYSIVNLSEAKLGENIIEHLKSNEINIPSNYDCLYYSHPQKGDKVFNANEIKECKKESSNIKTKNSFIIHSFKIAHFITSIGFRIIDYFTNSPYYLFYFGRLFNTLLSIVLLYLAIKITPKYKELFLCASTIPMFIQQMISYSYDSLLNSSIILSLAIILNLIYNKKANKILMYIILSILAIIIVNIKISYLFIYLLLLFVHDKENKKKDNKLITIIRNIIIAALCAFIVMFVLKHSNSLLRIIGKPNFLYIINNPLQLFPIIFNTFSMYTMYYIRGIFGYFGWMQYRLSDMYIIGYIVLLIYLVKCNDRIESKKNNYIIYIVGLILSFISIYAAMYIWYSEHGLNYVDGVQGRYLLPLLLPLLFVIMPKKAKFKLNNKYLYIFVSIILFSYIAMLLMWYY